MRIAIIGATGNVGSRITAEALRRGHQVTAVCRDVPKSVPQGTRVSVADIQNQESLCKAIAGHDAVIAAVAARGGNNTAVIEDGARNLLNCAEETDVHRVVWIGGAGCLEVAPGKMLMDQPNFPDDYKEEAEAQYGALEIFRANVGRRFQDEPDIPVDWLYISPAAELAPGERTGKFRIEGDHFTTGPEGHSRLSMEDLAVVAVGEVEKPQHHRERISVAY